MSWQRLKAVLMKNDHFCHPLNNPVWSVSSHLSTGKTLIPGAFSLYNRNFSSNSSRKRENNMISSQHIHHEMDLIWYSVPNCGCCQSCCLLTDPLYALPVFQWKEWQTEYVMRNLQMVPSDKCYFWCVERISKKLAVKVRVCQRWSQKDIEGKITEEVLRMTTVPNFLHHWCEEYLSKHRHPVKHIM